MISELFGDLCLSSLSADRARGVESWTSDMNEYSDVLSKKREDKRKFTCIEVILIFRGKFLHLRSLPGFPTPTSHSKAVAGGRVSELGVNINITMKRLPT